MLSGNSELKQLAAVQEGFQRRSLEKLKLNKSYLGGDEGTHVLKESSNRYQLLNSLPCPHPCLAFSVFQGLKLKIILTESPLPASFW